ncbi:response regulator transcription factor [Curvivirga aplysinae]|uniref:response regulator transcription factor n=1 Tax=Curvivirga aplysinae TaxID=2529852 RepID=UPI0012BB8308|nr:response regulator [Curvivirga aplysinae]MTI09757.1 response regulator [Curvivirga aplysinae]
MTHSVLIVEDDDSIVEALNFLMETAGFDVRIAREGPRAIELVKEAVPDVMILDVMLPGCDGFEVARNIRSHQLTKHIPILMLTAKNRPIDQEKAHEIGVTAFMTKPFSTREVVEKVKGMLNS